MDHFFFVQAPPRADLMFGLWTFIGVFLSIFMNSVIHTHEFGKNDDIPYVLMSGSFGALATLLFAGVCVPVRVACIHERMHACMHHACMYACMYACMHARRYVRMHVCMYVSMYACIRACMSICMYVFIYVFV